MPERAARVDLNSKAGQLNSELTLPVKLSGAADSADNSHHYKWPISHCHIVFTVILYIAIIRISIIAALKTLQVFLNGYETVSI